MAGLVEQNIGGRKVLVDTATGKAQLRNAASGKVEEIAPEALEDVLAEGGYGLATEQDVKAHDFEKNATVGDKAAAIARAGGAGFFQAVGAPVKLATAGVSKLTGTEQALKDWNPGYQTIGDLEGAVTELFTGKHAEQKAQEVREEQETANRAMPLSTAAAEFTGNLAGSGFQMGAGAGVSSLAGRALTKAGVGALATDVLSSSAGAAAEGALSGHMVVSDDAYFGDRDLAAEEILGATGLTTLAGGGIGAAVPLAGAGLRGLVNKGRTATSNIARRARDAILKDRGALEGVTETIAGSKPAPGIGAALRDVVEDAQSVVTGADRETIRKVGALRWDDDAIKARELYANRDEVLSQATVNLKKDLDDVLGSSREVFDEVTNAELKRSHVERNLADVNVPAALGKAQELTASLRQEFADVGANAERYGNKKLLKNLTTWADELDAAVAGAADTGDAAGAYIAMDRARRAVQKTQASLVRSAQRTTDALEIGRVQELSQFVQDKYLQLADNLMNPENWGKQGLAQQVNHKWVDLINSDKYGLTRFTRQVSEDINGRPIFAADDSKLAPFLKQLGVRDGNLAEEQFNEILRTNKALAEGIAEGYVLPPAKMEAVKRMQEAVNRIEATAAHIQKTVKVNNQIDAVMKAESGNPLNAALAGGLLGGLPGAALGAAAGVVTQPGRMLKIATVVNQMRRKFRGDVARNLETFFDRSAVSAVQGRLVSSARDALNRAGQRAKDAGSAAMPATLALFVGEHGTPQKAYRERVGEVLAMNKDGGELLRRNMPTTLGITDDAPEFSATLAVRASRAAAFLQSKIPAGLTNPLSPLHKPDARSVVSDLEIAKFARYWSAVNDPLSVFDDLKNGTLSHEQVEAVKTVYPAFYTEMRTATLEEVAKRGSDLSTDARVQLDTLLDLNGAGEPAFAPSLLVRVDAMRQAQEQAQQKNASRPPRSAGKPSSLTAARMSGSQAMEARRDGP